MVNTVNSRNWIIFLAIKNSLAKAIVELPPLPLQVKIKIIW